ncbi:hypothetical protein [[Bacillus] enclensis]|uniref:hypothetical protein n=1 Tax=[Bacillus] enclensis TaxID=1402860 RepID=UPI0018DDF0B6|nr:hypothetical protein [[Bacillus] enclensis]MBH9967998.1 hypothetical protein [[Bacillus] enclensis]
MDSIKKKGDLHSFKHFLIGREAAMMIILSKTEDLLSKKEDLLSKTEDLLSKKTILLSKRPIPLVSATHLPKNDKFRRLLQLPAAIHAAIYHPPIKNNKKDDPSKKESSLSIYLGAITIYLLGSRPSE